MTQRLDQLLADGDQATQLARARAEIARLRAELAGAEERGAAGERAAVVAWLRDGDDTLGPGYEGPATSYAAQIERGDHVRTGTAKADDEP